MSRLRLDLAIVLVLAISANFLYLACSNGDFFYPDSATYLAPARSLLAGRGFSDENGEPETFRTPGYPLLLIPFLLARDTAVAVVTFQHLCNVLLTLLIYLFTEKRVGRSAALIAAAFFAVDVPTIHYANKVLSETSFTLLLFIVLMLMMRSHSSGWLSGGLSGLLVMIRPVAILYFAVVALLKRRAIATIVVAALVFPLGWAVRNQLRTGIFTISAVAGTNMLFHRAAPAIAIFDDYDFNDALADRQDELHEQADDEIQRALRIADAEELNAAVRGAWYGKIGRRIALRHPVGLALVIVRGVLVSLFDSDWEALMLVSRVPPAVIEVVMKAWTYCVGFLAGVGLIGLWKRDRQLALAISLTLAYYILISAGSEAEARFRVPLMPMIAVAAGCGLERLRPRHEGNAARAIN
jgi:hypothetical protein